MSQPQEVFDGYRPWEKVVLKFIDLSQTLILVAMVLMGCYGLFMFVLFVTGLFFNQQ